jgi:cell division protein FtsN
MRIDYSEPKKSCSSTQSTQSRPRKESSSGGALLAALFSGFICLIIGFGSGWMISQRSAKKAFKAAMEQQSLENSPQQIKAALPTPPPTAPPAPVQQTPANSPSQPPAAANAPQTPKDQPLSFYKTLPSGQKSNVLGSGINTKEDKPAKQPLQAAMPTNLTKPAVSQNDDAAQKQPPQNTPAKPGATSFTVQVASYSLKSEAETVRSNLAAKGYSVVITESHLGDKGTWFRVRVGNHLNQDAAKELAKKLGKGAIAIPDKD